MDNNTLKILGLGVVAWYLFIRKEKPEPIVIEEIKDISGCTDSTADNYNEDATIDDESCEFATFGCNDPLATNFDPLATTDDGTCDYTPVAVLGCTNPVANNYNNLATQDDATCTFTEVDCWSGCPTPAMTPSVGTICPTTHPSLQQPSCAVPITGCQNTQAYNYNPNATVGCN